MAKTELRSSAHALRRSGKSIKEIARSLHVSPSTVSLWVRDIVLTSVQENTLRARMIAAGDRGRLMGAETNRRKRLEKISRARKEAAREIQSLSRRELLYLGLGLYWGEGTKAVSSALAISNSDPAILITAMQWFERCFEIRRDDFRPRIFINATHRDREQKLLAYWAKMLRLPKSQFSKTVFITRPNKKVYENHETYYGIVALRIRRGTNLRYRILAHLEQLAKQVAQPA